MIENHREYDIDVKVHDVIDNLSFPKGHWTIEGGLIGGMFSNDGSHSGDLEMKYIDGNGKSRTGVINIKYNDMICRTGAICHGNRNLEW